MTFSRTLDKIGVTEMGRFGYGAALCHAGNDTALRSVLAGSIDTLKLAVTASCLVLVLLTMHYVDAE